MGVERKENVREKEMPESFWSNNVHFPHFAVSRVRLNLTFPYFLYSVCFGVFDFVFFLPGISAVMAVVVLAPK
jgi:hypothetical protein